MAKRKIILFIVEGPSDADFLEPVLSELLSTNQVIAYVVHGDITTSVNEHSNQHDNIRIRLNKCINHFLRLYSPDFKISDICKVVLLTDLDGCFIPLTSEFVHEKDSDKIQKNQYFKDHIETLCFDSQIQVMKNKARTLKELSTIHEISKTKSNGASGKKAKSGLPFSCYFMGVNLEDAFGLGKNNTNAQKEEISLNLVTKYESDSIAFVHDLLKIFRRIFQLSNVPEDSSEWYAESWKEVQKDLRSLQSCSNLFCFLNDSHDMLKDTVRLEVQRLLDITK